MSALLKYFDTSDRFLLNVFNRKIRCKFFDILMPIITYIGSATFVSLMCLGALISNDSKIHSVGVKCSVTLLISNIIAQILKFSVNRIRPFLKIENLNIKKIGIDKYSFPSGHTTAAFSMAVMFSLTFSSFSFVFIAVASLVGISRMYLGVHYPSDVIVGSLLGTVTSIILFNII